MSGRLIIVSNRLPLSAQEKRGRLEFTRSNGGLATALASIFDPATARWVGWPGLRRVLKTHEIRRAKLPNAYELIGLDDKTLHGFYDTIANGVWWPELHGLEPTISPTREDWAQAKKAVEVFADRIANTTDPEDTIWIHDYQLFWLPKMLRDRGLKNKIGFFLHTPFLVSKKVARSRDFTAVLESLSTVDLLGMQTKRDVENWQALTKKLSSHPRTQAFPIGITAADFVERRLSPRVQTLAAKYRQKVGRRVVIVSISRLDYTKGLLTELKAFRQFLRTTKRPRNYVLRLNVAPSRESVEAYGKLKKDIEQTVDSINQEFSHFKKLPVWYSYDNMDLDELVAWYRIARVHLNTPVADGMNLVVKEYIAARNIPGSIVISSTMGAADELTSAVIVPPNDVDATAAGIEKAVTLSPAARLRRWQKMKAVVFSHQASDWAREFLAELKK